MSERRVEWLERWSGGPATAVTDVSRRALRFWPVGVAVAVVTAVIGLALTWEPPRLYVSRATVYPPAVVTNRPPGSATPPT